MEKASLIKGIEILNGTARLAISEDIMSVKIYAISEDFEPSILDDIEYIMEEVGITANLLSSMEQENDHWIVARGTEPMAGEDGRIEMCVGMKDSRYTSKGDVDEKDSDNRATPDIIDPRDRNFIINIQKNSCIAKKIPPTKGMPGKNVLGEIVPAIPGEWIDFSPGSGVKILEDGTALCATVTGGVYVENGVISVLDEWEIDGSVDMSTGHVNFMGGLLTVKGSISGGFMVSVKDDLIIEGNIEDGANVEAGGNLHVEGFIRAQNTTVKAGGNITCTAVEYAEINAGGDIIINDYLLDAACRAGENVTITSNKGLVAGGKVLLGGSFEGKLIGTPANVPTIIHAGFNPHIKNIHDKEVAELKKYAQKRTELQGALSKIELVKNHKGHLPKKLKDIKTEINEGIANITRASTKKIKMIEELEAQIGILQAATVKIQQKAYPNSIIRIANADIVLKKEVETVLCSFRSGQVVLSII